MPEQLRQPLDDRKSEPEPLAPVALGIPELREFLENLGVLLGGNARSRIPHFDADLLAATPAADRDPAALGVAHGIRHQVADDPREQSWIAAYVHRSCHNMQRQPFLFCHRRIFEGEPLEHLRERNRVEPGADRSRVEPRNIQKRVEQLLHRIHGAAHVADELVSVGRQRSVLQRLHEQFESVQRLAQIVAGYSEEARLGDVRLLGGLLLSAQLLHQLEVLQPNARPTLAVPAHSLRP